MDETSDPGPAGQIMDLDHDHAWRKVRVEEPDAHLLVGEYACDLCHATWSL